MLEAPYRSEKDLCILENSQNTAPIGTTGPRLPAPQADAASFLNVNNVMLMSLKYKAFQHVSARPA